MRLGVRSAATVVTATIALLAAACTIEDASDKRAADSAAAATAKDEVKTSASGGAVASPQPAPASAQTPPATAPVPAPGSTVDSTSAVSTANTTPAADSSTATRSKPSSGSLSPDSVDLGRTSRSVLLPLATTRIEVDLAARQLTVYDGDERVGSYRVAVGSKEWPTKAGDWSITQVVWNPEWIPPKDEAWAESKDPKKPGAPDNPLGRVQLVYDPPRTIHGTNEPQSIGKAVSHGSIRLANADAVKLARQLMEVTGVKKDDGWFRQVQQKRTEKVPVELPQRVAIRIF